MRAAVHMALFALAIALPFRNFAEPPAHVAAGRLIVPGKSIGELRLGPDRMVYNGAEADGSDAAMGGKEMAWWYLGARPGAKGRPFHRPDEIGTVSLKDMEHDSAKNPGKVTITEVYVTSPRFVTADGIGAGSTIAAVFAKYPDIHLEREDAEYWPLYGKMQLYKDRKDGIAFAIQKSSGACIEVCVMPPGEERYFVWARPLATEDYRIDTVEEEAGGIQFGMSGPEITALLGRPDEKEEAGSVAGGEWWRWWVPPQGAQEAPGFSVYMRKLPDGRLAAFQIRVTSPAFTVTDEVFPGCPLKEALEATARVAKIATYPNHAALYGDLFSGILFEVRPADSVCTAISLFPAPLDSGGR